MKAKAKTAVKAKTTARVGRPKKVAVNNSGRQKGSAHSESKSWPQAESQSSTRSSSSCSGDVRTVSPHRLRRLARGGVALPPSLKNLATNIFQYSSFHLHFSISALPLPPLFPSSFSCTTGSARPGIPLNTLVPTSKCDPFSKYLVPDFYPAHGHLHSVRHNRM